jgi:class 3 adenylate cyclase
LHGQSSVPGRCFTAFDEIMDEHGVEKLKTIGDAYMAVGGLPVRNETHPVDVVRAALRMAEAMERHRPDGAAVSFKIRIGVHTGPLVAGVIGRRRFLYDVWGDTVNVASRMESSGEVGRVNISAATYELVKQRFVCTPRGKIRAKDLGAMEMYFVEREREPAADGEC